MNDREKFPLLMEDGNIIFNEEEFDKYKIIKNYIEEENKNYSSLSSSDNNFYGGYGINLI
ncbi:hypothetical protein SAMN04487886_100714 [Clostridium sp. DSM 8431]|uniref:hypothetical protein n=1 Tax=Clostridium sp. DSM 8431 TaxID=1761781 RepID=UPI0008E503D7|nr:hypothetical protein [Clostridium sp. DSM 8431]SFU32549.1 hypothetical protein SAMN04487886_100714 [Clostridium sp. DSM 8431]